MNGLLRTGMIGFALSLALAPSVSAKPLSTTSAISGTWQLNMTASKGMPPAMKSETRVYTVDGDKVTMLSDIIDTSGKHSSNSYSAAYDDKFYPTVNNPVGDSIALKKVDSHTVTAILHKGSAIAATARAVVSHDGKHLTITRKTGTPPAKLVVTVAAYDRK
jgi:hypothetical protein